MRQVILDLVEIAVKHLPAVEPIYEFGSFQVPGQETFADLRRFFPEKQYTGFDLRPGPGVDAIEDVTRPGFIGHCGVVLMVDTLEHVADPFEAVTQCFHMLRDGGWCLITSVMDFPIHNEPSDYWRFTPEGLLLLFVDLWSRAEVAWVGRVEQPHTVVVFGFKGEEWACDEKKIEEVDALMMDVDEWGKEER